MPLVLRSTRVPPRRPLARLLTAAIAIGLTGAAALACTDGVVLPPLIPPDEDSLPPVDPNDPAFQRTSHVVALDGTSQNTGDATAPWDLSTALSGAGGRVTPGDTIWIRGAVYRGAFTSTVAGTASAPVLVRGWPFERVMLDHLGSEPTTLTVRGEWSTFQDLEVTNSDALRSAPTDAHEFRPNGIVNNASHTRYINLVVHDAGVGFYNYSHASDVEVYGSTFYNNGWEGPSRGHGHAFYVKSDAGPLVLRENVIFNQFGWGVHAYTPRGTGKLNGIRIERNVAFGNGTLATSPSAQNILLGGDDFSTGSVVTGNVSWFASGTPATNVRIGYGSLQNGTVGVADNLFVGGNPVLRLGHWVAADFERNVLGGTARMVQLDDESPTGYVWAATEQYRDPLSLSWVLDGVASPFTLWSTLTGLGVGDLVTSATPSTAEVRVWPNEHEPGRALLVVLNWPRATSVTVALDGVLAPGDSFEVRNIQDLHGPPVVAGTYAGPLEIPTTGVSPPIPIGLTSSRAPRTGPELEVFVVRRR